MMATARIGKRLLALCAALVFALGLLPYGLWALAAEEVIGTFDLSASGPAVDGGGPTHLGKDYDTAKGELRVTMQDTGFYTSGARIDLKLNAGSEHWTYKDTAYLVFDVLAPRNTKFSITFFKAGWSGDASASVGVVPKGGDFVTVKIPVSDYTYKEGLDLSALAAVRLTVAEGFRDEDNFLRAGEAVVLRNMRFVKTDPGADIQQNKDLKPVLPGGVIGTFDLAASKPANDNGKPTYLTESYDAAGKTLTVTLDDEAFYASGARIDLKLNADSDHWAHRETAYLVMDVKAPHTTKIKVSMYDSGWAASNAVAGVVTDGSDFVTVKIPVSDFIVGDRDLTTPKSVRIYPADGFKDARSFLKKGESIVLRNIRFVVSDPGADIQQNKDLPAIEPEEVIGTFDLSASKPAVDGGSAVTLTKTYDADSGELSVKLVSTDFYTSKERIDLKLNAGSTHWVHKETAYLVFDVQAPRNTKLVVELFDQKWAASSTRIGVVTDGSGFVTVKCPVSEFISGDRDLTNPVSVRLQVDKSFKNPDNFLQTGESIVLRNMRFVKTNPGYDIPQNKDLQPVEEPVEEVIGTFDLSASGPAVDGGSAVYLGKAYDADTGELSIQLKDTAFYTSKERIDLKLNAGSTHWANKDTAYLMFDVQAPRNTKFVVELFDANWAASSTKIGVVTDGSGFVTVKCPVSEFINGDHDLTAPVAVRLRPADEFKNPYNFLYPNEAIVLRNMRFVKTDPGADIPQNKDLQPAEEPVEEVIGTFDLSASGPAVDGGSAVNLVKAYDAASGELRVKLADTAFYASEERIDLKLNPGSTHWANKATAYLVFDVQAPRSTKFVIEMFDANWAASSTKIGVVTDGSGFVTVKCPVSEFISGDRDLTTPKSVRLRVADEFKNARNFLQKDEAIVLRNMRFVKTDPGTHIQQNKDLQPQVEESPYLGVIDLAASKPGTDSGTQYLEKVEGEGELNIRLNGIDFYSSANRIDLKLKPGATYWAHKETAFLTFEVKAPRATKLSITLFAQGWSGDASAQVGVVPEGNGFVKVKIPVADFAYKEGLDLSNPVAIRLDVEKTFRDSHNFLKMGEVISFRNMRFEAEDPGDAVLQNKDLQPAAQPAEEVIGTFDLAASGPGSDNGGATYLTKVDGDGQLNLQLDSEAFYSSGAYITLKLNGGSTHWEHRDTAYLVFDVKAPRATMFSITMYRTDWTGDASAQVGYVPADDGFVTVKIPVYEFTYKAGLDLSGTPTVRIMPTRGFDNAWNFLAEGEVLSIRNMRFVKEDPGKTVRQNKDLKALEEPEKTPEEIAQEKTRLAFTTEQFEKKPYTDAFLSDNDVYKACVGILLEDLTYDDPEAQLFKRYASYVVLDEDLYYEKSFPIQFFNSLPSNQRNLKPYVDYATVRFWARVPRDMEVSVKLVDTRTWKSCSIPVALKKTENNQFREYQIPVKDMLAYQLEQDASYTFDFTDIQQLRIEPVNKTPDGFLKKNESLDVASPEIWTKEALVPDMSEQPDDTAFRYEGEGIVLESSGGALPADTRVEVEDLEPTEDELEMWKTTFGPDAVVKLLKKITLFDAEGSRVEPKGKVWLSLAMPDGVDPADVKLFKVYIDGSADAPYFAIEGRSVTAQVYSMGTFALVTGAKDTGKVDPDDPAPKPGGDDDLTPNEPVTGGEPGDGDSTATGDALPAAALLTMGAALSLLGLSRVRRTRRAKGGTSR